MIAAHKGEIAFAILLLPFLAGIGLGILFSYIFFYYFSYRSTCLPDRSVYIAKPAL